MKKEGVGEGRHIDTTAPTFSNTLQVTRLNPESPQQQNVKQVRNLQWFKHFLAQEICLIAIPETVSVQFIKVNGSVA
jgi:hypothetical protein